MLSGVTSTSLVFEFQTALGRSPPAYPQAQALGVVQSEPEAMLNWGHLE